MKRTVYIVSRDHPRQYAKFKQAFADKENVEVVLDRRYSQRRQAYEVPAVERRSVTRRWRDTSSILKTIGWAVVFQPLDGGGEVRRPAPQATAGR